MMTIRAIIAAPLFFLSLIILGIGAGIYLMAGKIVDTDENEKRREGCINFYI